jgi:phospholipase C
MLRNPVVADVVCAGRIGCGSVQMKRQEFADHVVILIQENRSFDHYFGSYRGVRGFSDQSMAFQQPDPPNTTNVPIDVR